MPERTNTPPGAGRTSDPAFPQALDSIHPPPSGLASSGTNVQDELRWLASFPELNSNPVTEVDLQTACLVYANPAARRIMPGLVTPAANNLEHPWLAGLHPIAEQLNTGKEHSVRREIQVDESYFDQTITCPDGGTRLRIYGVDVTRRVHIERQLERARFEAVQASNRLATIMEMLPVGVALADFEGNHVLSNAMFHRIWGCSPPAESGFHERTRKAGPLPPPIRQDQWAAMRAASTGEPVTGQLIHIRKFDGSRAFVLNNTTTVFGADGEIIGSAIAMMDVTERVEAEQALRESREDLNHAQAVARTGSWRLDLRHNRLLWSDENYRIFGAPKGTPQNYQTFLERVHPDDRAHVDAQWQAALAGAPYDCEHRLAGDGPVRWVRERAVLEFGPDGALIAGFGTTQDITEKKEAEQALLRAKDEWERTFDAVPDLIAIIDENHRIRRVNRAMAERLGLPVQSCIGKHCYEVVHGTGCPPGTCPHTCTMFDGKEHNVEVHEARIGGDFLVSTTPLKDEHGRRIGSVHVARDITARKHTERMLAESEQRYRSLFDLSPDAVVVMKEERIVFLNPAGAKLFGAPSPGSLIGENLIDRLAEEDRARFAEPLWRILEGREGSFPPLSCTIVGLDQQRREAEASAVPVPFDGSSAVQLVFRDISERNRVQRTLRESQQRLAQAMLVGRCFAFEWNPDTDEVIRARECQSILGLVGDEVTNDTGSRFFSRVHPEDRDAFLRTLQQLTPAAETYRVKYRVIRPDGATVILEEMARGNFQPDGRLVRLVGITFDITEREHNQAALRQSEQRYALAQKAASIASWEWNLRSDEISWSDQIDLLLGFSPGTFGRSAQSFLDCVHPDDRSWVEGALRAAAQNGAPYNVEHRIRRQDGSIRWVSAIAEIHPDGAGCPARMVGIIGDITRRKLGEQARAEYLSRVTALVRISREVLAESSMSGLFKLAASAAELLTDARQVVCAREYRNRTFIIAAQRERGADLPQAEGNVVFLTARDPFQKWLAPEGAPLSSRFRAFPSWWTPTDPGSAGSGLLAAKLTARDAGATGFLMVANKSDGVFTAEDEALLAQLAALVSVGQQRLEARQEALRRANELHTVFSAMSEMVIVYDGNGIPVHVNPAAVCLFGFDPAGLPVESIMSRLRIRHLDGRRLRKDEMPCQRTLAGETVRNARLTVTSKAGVDYIVLASASRLMDGQQLLGAVCVWHDVTERERLVSELELRVEERTAGLNRMVIQLEREIRERERAEAALSESEERYRTLFQHAPVGIVMTDYSGAIQEANEAAASILGCSRKKLLSLAAQQFYANRADRKRLIQDVRTTGRAESQDLLLRRCDQRTIQAAVQLNRLELRGREALMTLVQDLTESKQAQRRDQGVKKLLELFATQSSQQEYLVSVVTFLKQWCACHSAGIRLLTPAGGMPYAACAGFPAAFVRSEEQLCAQKKTCPCVRAMKGNGTPAEKRYATSQASFICNQMAQWLHKPRARAKSSKVFPCADAGFESVAHVPIRFHQEILGAIHLADRRQNRFPDQVAYFIESIAPIIGEALHRFGIEAELREREQRLRSMFEHHEAVMLLIDPSTGRIRDANAAASRFYGYPEQRLRSMNMDDLRATPATRLMHEHAHAAREHRPSYVVTQRIASGEVRAVEVHSSPIKVGAVQAHFCIIHDITERKRLEQRILEIGDKERQSIGRDLHDSLGGNLTGIALITKGLAQALRERELPEKALAEEVVNAVNQAISQSRSIARGVCPVGLGRFGLATGLQEYAVSTSKLFRVPFRFRTRGDVVFRNEQLATHLYRIVQEAVANALRHGRAKSIEISLEGRKQAIILSVKDDGVGFSPTDLSETGMGMRTMQFRAEIIGAHLKVNSTPGKGTVVSCIVPRGAPTEIRAAR